MQIHRLFEIIYLLLERRTVTAKQLSERFEVSTRTIYRDVENLSAAGIPIYMSKGKGGGISLLPDFVLNKTVLTESEKQDILSSLQAMKALDCGDGESVFQRLSALFGDAGHDWIEIDFSSWANGTEEKSRFNTLKTAILSRLVITFRYSGGNGLHSDRTVEPLKLCFKSSAWYVYGFCRLRGDFRFFKLSRIQALKLGEENFRRDAPAQIFTDGEIYPQPFVRMKLWFSKQAAYRIYDELENVSMLPDGNYIAEVSYPAGEWLLHYIATYGSTCEVLEPQEIREKLKTELEKTLSRYR